METFRYGIFGCTADPITIAHKVIIESVIKQGLVDEVIVAPTIVDWHRSAKDKWLNDSERCFAIKSVVESIEGKYPISVYDKDVKMRTLCDSSNELLERYVNNRGFIDTLMDIKAMCNSFGPAEYEFKPKYDFEFYPIIGIDSFRQIKTWRCYKMVLEQSNGIIVVNGRNNDVVDCDNFEGCKIIPLNIEKRFSFVSATKIREKWSGKRNGLERYLKTII